MRSYVVSKGKITKIEGVERAVSEFFDSQSPQLWKKEIADLPIRWHTVAFMTKDGVYTVE